MLINGNNLDIQVCIYTPLLPLCTSGRFSKTIGKQVVLFKHSVRSVVYDKAIGKFRVSVKNLSADQMLPEELFDFVVNCTGHFSVPNIPIFKGNIGHTNTTWCHYKGRFLYWQDVT